MALSTNNNMFEQSDVRETITNVNDSSVRFNLAYARYIQTFDTENHNAKGLFFSPDGLKMYVADSVAAVSTISEYDLSTAWDVSTAVINQTLEVTAKETQLMNLHFSPDGLKMYTLGYSANDTIDEYDLSTAWDISTASWLQELNVVAHGGTLQGFYIREDGKKFWVCGTTSNAISEYIMTTAWDISTGIYVTNKVFNGATGLSFSRDGAYVFIMKAGTQTITRYEMTTVFQIQTAAADTTLSIVPANNCRDIFFKPNGTKMYVLDDSNGYIQENTISRGWR